MNKIHPFLTVLILMLALDLRAARNVTISSALPTIGGSFVGGVFTPTQDNAVVNVNTINLMLSAGQAVTITTGATGTQPGNITVSAEIHIFDFAPLTLSAQGSVTFNASILGLDGNLYVTAGAAITQSSPIMMNDMASFSAGSANITLSHPQNFFGSVSLPSANNVVLTVSQGTTLGTSTISGNLTLNAAGLITQSGPLTMTGPDRTATFNAGGANDIILDNSANNFQTVVISSANNVVLTDNSGFNFGASTISGVLMVNTSGAITQSGALTVNGDAWFNAGFGSNITLDLNGNNFSAIAFSQANQVAVNDINALVLGPSTIGGNLIVTASGNVTQTGPLSVTGTATFITGLNNVTLNNAFNDFNTLNVPFANDVMVTDTDDLNFETVFISGDLIVNTFGSISQNGPIQLNVPGRVAIFNAGFGDITLNNANNDFTSIGILSANNVVLADRSGMDFLPSTIQGNFLVLASGNISQFGPLTVNGASTFSIGNFGNLVLGDGNNNFQMVTIPSANNVLLSAMNNVQLGFITVSGNLTVNSPSDVIQFAPVQAFTITLNANHALLGNTLSAIQNLNVNGPIQLINSMTMSGSSIFLMNTITGGGNGLTVNGPATLFGQSMDIGGSQFTFQNTLTIAAPILSVQNWNGSTNGGGAARFVVNSGSGLPSSELSKVRFINPTGFPAGTYRGKNLATGEIIPIPRPTLQIARQGSNAVLTWGDTSVLQSSTNVAGPYADVLMASSPYTNAMGSVLGMFFRLR